MLAIAPQFLLGLTLLGQVTDHLDGADYFALSAIQRTGLVKQVQCSAAYLAMAILGHQGGAKPLDMLVVRQGRQLISEYEINQHRPPLTIKRQGVFVITLAEHVRSAYPGHLLHGPVPDHHPALTVDGKHRIGQKLDDIAQALLRFAQGLFHLLALGDIGPHCYEIIAPGNLDQSGANAHIAHAAIAVPVAGFKHPTATSAHRDTVLHDLRRTLAGLDILHAPAIKLGAAVAEVAAGGLVELDKTPALKIDQRDRVTCLVNDGAVNRFALAQCLLRGTQFGNVMGDTEHPDQPAAGIPQGHLGGLEQAAIAGRGKRQPFLIAQRLAGIQGIPVMGAKKLGQFGSDEIVIGAANDGSGTGAIELFKGTVAGQIDPIGVLDPDRVGNGRDQRFEQSALAFQIGDIARRFVSSHGFIVSA